ncbi:MAG: hypothetical protein JO025_02875 [Verrucomicrobia bacterium]|nr:hypothetical protein [Verrucomicrobiota bacterium]
MGGQPQPQRSPAGCRWGCLLLACVFVVIIGAIIWGAVSTYESAYQMTSPSPRTFPPIAEGGAQAVQEKLQQAEEELAKGGSPEVHLTADEFNAWFLDSPNNRELAKDVRFRIEADWLVAEASFPLTFMAQLPLLPGFHDRYFNGKLAVRLSVDHGELKVEAFDLEGNGARLPWLTTSQDFRQTVSQGINKALRDSEPEDQVLLNAIQSIQIANNEIVVKFGKGDKKPGG